MKSTEKLPIHPCTFRTGTMLVCSQDLFVHVFPDGTTNHFHVDGLADSDEYKEIAKWAGYGDDWRLYALEHELAHHMVADIAGQPWSHSVHDNPPTIEDPKVSKEEHVVNELQRWANGIQDDPHGQLREIAGHDINNHAALLKRIAAEAVASPAWQAGFAG